MSNGINGYGLTIYNDGTQDVCGLLDGSPVLHPTRIERTATGRRFRFVEGTRELRTLGDIFCSDMRTAGFVREAVSEKLERLRAQEEDRERLAKTAFVVESAVERERAATSIIDVKCSKITSPHDIMHLKFTVGCRDAAVNMTCRGEFEAFLGALGIARLDHVEDLIGKTASMPDDSTFVPWTPLWKLSSERAAN